MEPGITASVGRGGTNRPADVKAVQALLLLRGFDPGSADGVCSAATVAAILAFQRDVLKRPDGLVEPGGTTFKALVSDAAPALTSRVMKPSPGSINQGLHPVTNGQMIAWLGHPREQYSRDCQSPTHLVLRRHMKTARVAGFKVTGLAPAVDSLQRALDEVRQLQPAAYAALGTAGMLCCRFQRGSIRTISNHSWGTAIDFTLDCVLDTRGDNFVQYGMTLIAPILNRHGWYWGAGFPVEDGMHFEASAALVESWLPRVG